MSEKDKKLMEKFMRFMGLLHRYQMLRFNNRGPFGNPHRGQGRVLSILKLQPEISQKELLYLLDMSKQALGELLIKLERSGYITRTTSEEDRRAAIIKLTPEGMAAAGDIDKEQSQAENLFDCLSEEDQERFSSYLDRLIAELEKSFADSGMYHVPFGRHMGGHHGAGMGSERYGAYYGENDHHQVFGHGSHYGRDRQGEHHHSWYPEDGRRPEDEE